MEPDKPILDRRRLRWIGLAAVVIAAHLALGWWVARTQPSAPPTILPPPLNVIVLQPFLPPPPPPPPPPARPSANDGGGRPSAPSVVRPTPSPTRPPEVTAPPRPAPEPPLVIGNAPTESPTPGPGQGQQGTGTGTGSGDGDGPGVGGRAQFVRGPSQREIIARYPPAARAARMDGQVSLRCRVRLDQRLEACRVVRETPPGQGFGAAAVQIAETAFRFRPPVRDGRAVEGSEVVVGIAFGRGVPGG